MGLAQLVMCALLCPADCKFIISFMQNACHSTQDYAAVISIHTIYKKSEFNLPMNKGAVKNNECIPHKTSNYSHQFVVVVVNVAALFLARTIEGKLQVFSVL